MSPPNAPVSLRRRPPREFPGALVRVREQEVLLVAVRPWVFADPDEPYLLTLGFELRTRRPTVLVSQTAPHTRGYFGRESIVPLVKAIRFDTIRWYRIPLASLRAWRPAEQPAT